MSDCENNDAQYWYIGVIIAVVIILIVILVMLLTLKTETKVPLPICKSAEYPTIAENISCDPNIVEVSLTASDNEVQILSGDATKLYNYNKSFPGPLIEAKVGDTLIVNFFNDICEPTSITWHGLLTQANMDGSQISAFPIQPGESFIYKFELKNSGLYWYHSDINSREQVSMGLFGVILVKDYEQDTRFSLPCNEKVLAFSDLKLDSANQIDIEFSSVPCERTSQQINGILGNVILTNGVYNGCISLDKNVPARLYLVNCSADRFMKIFLEGHDMLRIGGDQGLLERPILIKEKNGLVLTTGERAEIVFVPRTNNIKLYTEANVRGKQKIEVDDCGNCELCDTVEYNDEKILLVTFRCDNNTKEEKLEIPLQLEKIKKIKVDKCTPVIPVYYGNYEPDCEGNIDFFAFRVDKKGVPFEKLNRKEAPIIFENGIYIIEITNTSPLANNFYLHGFTFQYLETLFITKENIERSHCSVLENKDTIYIPAKPKGKKSKTIVRLAVDFRSKDRDIIAYGKQPTEHRSGGWIFQSHILTHAELGQEGFIQIVGECDRKSYSSEKGYINSYSKYESGEHSFCLSRSKNYDTNNFDELSRNLEQLTRSLVTCKCGSGINASLCNCSKSSSSSSLESSSSSLEYSSSLESSKSSKSSKSLKSSSNSLNSFSKSNTSFPSSSSSVFRI